MRAQKILEEWAILNSSVIGSCTSKLTFLGGLDFGFLLVLVIEVYHIPFLCHGTYMGIYIKVIYIYMIGICICTCICTCICLCICPCICLCICIYMHICPFDVCRLYIHVLWYAYTCSDACACIVTTCQHIYLFDQYVCAYRFACTCRIYIYICNQIDPHEFTYEYVCYTYAPLVAVAKQHSMKHWGRRKNSSLNAMRMHVLMGWWVVLSGSEASALGKCHSAYWQQCGNAPWNQFGTENCSTSILRFAR